MDFDGDYFQVSHARVRQGASRSIDIWLGGRVPAAFRRIGRYGDGWLGSFVTPTEAEAAVAAIQTAAAAADRTVDHDHFGITVLMTDGPASAELASRIAAQRPEVDPAKLVPTSWPHLHRLIDDYIDAGLSKFVVIPAGIASMSAFVESFAAELIPRQT